MTPSPSSQEEAVFVSVTCGGEYCRCGEPAVRKVGEEIPGDDPMPRRHNLTAYVCARHYAELMGPLGAKHVGYTRPTPDLGDVDELVERLLRIETEGNEVIWCEQGFVPRLAAEKLIALRAALDKNA